MPPKTAPSNGGSWLTEYMVPVPRVHSCQRPKRHLDHFSHFCRAHCCDQQTDRHNTKTHRPRDIGLTTGCILCFAAGAGAQQQMWETSCWQLTVEAQHELVICWFSTSLLIYYVISVNRRSNISLVNKKSLLPVKLRNSTWTPGASSDRHIHQQCITICHWK